MRVQSTLLGLAAAAGLAEAQYLINELSFGYTGRISPDGTSGIVPNFGLWGTPNPPDVLSNKLVMTPPAPGNQRTAVWAERVLAHKYWVTDVDFRATGPERGGGNLNIWLVRSGADEVGQSSIYTVGRFDGLALVVDTHGGSAGMIRGFLNDGTEDYGAKRNIDELAFGHCNYAYRNLGRPSQIKLRQTLDAFRVEVDGKLCFESDKFSIPAGYRFGITAATPDNPDSFEVFKLVVMSESLKPDGDGSQQQQEQQQQQQQQNLGGGVPETQERRSGGSPPRDSRGGDAVPDDPYDSSIPDEEADLFTSSKAQFTDLHNRLQAVNHHVSTVFRQVAKHHQMDETRHAEVSKMIDGLREELRRLDLTDIQNKLGNLERDVRTLKKEVQQRVKDSEQSLKGFMKDHHSTLSESIMDAPRGHGRLILVIVACQVVVAGGYIMYKRKKNSSPKKYL